MHMHDTIAAIATPTGLGAIGVIRVSGPDAITLTDRAFGGKLAAAAGHTAHFGRFKRLDGTVLDEVLVTVFRAPRSFTREDTCEISFHGSPYILREAMQVLADLGARPALPGEFTQRAYLNGALDLAQAEAVADLIASSSARAHTIALQQLRGGVSNEIQRLRADLLHFTSLLELELDFAEEDVEFADRGQLLALVGRIRALTLRLVESFRLGNAIKEGIATVIAGRPNAGKSTLLNALLQEDRAIVSDIPGTTRDTIEEALVIEGLRYRLIDTAGIREAQDTIEAIGVERTLASIAKAQVLVYLYDPHTTSAVERDADLSRLQQPGLHVVVVRNKCDVAGGLAGLAAGSGSEVLPGEVLISAREGMGLDGLRAALLATGGLDADHAGEVVISNVRHLQALQKAAAALESAEGAILGGLTQELVALDIRLAVHHLGEITGEITTDEVLGNIFSKFCIGK
jgi:tRNA modification GTPase